MVKKIHQNTLDFRTKLFAIKMLKRQSESCYIIVYFSCVLQNGWVTQTILTK